MFDFALFKIKLPLQVSADISTIIPVSSFVSRNKFAIESL